MKNTVIKPLIVSYGTLSLEGGLNVILIALMPYFASTLHMDIADTSLFVTAKNIGTFLLLYISGRLSDRFGKKRMILLGLLAMLVFLFGLSGTQSVLVLLMFCFIGGLGHGLSDAPSMSLLYDIFPKNSSSAIGLVQFFFALGSIIVSGIVSTLLGSRFSMQWLFVPIIVYILFLIVNAIITVYPTTATESHHEMLSDMFHVEPRIKREGILLFLCVGVFSAYFAILLTWLPTYLSEVKGFSTESGVLMLSYLQGGSVIGALIFAQIIRKLHTSVLMMVNPILALVLSVVMLQSHNTYLIMMLITLIGGLMGSIFSFCIAMSGELFYKAKGAAAGATSTANMLANVLATFLSGQLLKIVGIDLTFNVSFVLLSVLVGLMLIFRWHYKRIAKIVHN